ncbi:hypothetical protein [Coleofasciculus sp. E1-EBD-02]|uniref:hypothetical protein n=1 Tax=Coleofasciculus sp. E1-EBD-02 TaxID=3068481 RepID=UPI0032F4E6C2
MMRIRHRINPQTFVITLNQIAKYLNIDPQRILNWEKWHNVLWVHIQGRGGYFVSYRNLEQWIAACRTLIRFCPNREALNLLWSLIQQEAQRYTKQVWDRLQAMCQQRYTELSRGAMVISLPLKSW